MKKQSKKMILSGFLALAFLAYGLTGCGSRGESTEKSEEGLKIVCTIFPEYDWTRQILGNLEGKAELSLLLKNGSDLHSYQPTVWDMMEISEADLFICVGGESDFWVEDALANAKNPDRKVLNLMEILEAERKEEEHVEGMRSHSHSEDAHDGGEGPEYDEHVWLSLKNAEKVCQAIGEALCQLDPENSGVYLQNQEEYLKKLDTLDQRYEETVKNAEKKILLFGDRFPFRYLTDDYDLEYYAAFAGCSAETEASFETITFLSGKVDELSLPTVLTLDGSDGKIARTIAENARKCSAEVLMLDSMQSVSEADIEQGENYLSIMEKNLEVLEKALSVQGRKQS